MTNVASLENCKKLYELSGWANYEHLHIIGVDNSIPAYDLGFMLSKLPRHLTIKKAIYHLCLINGNAQDDNWIADYLTVGRLCWLHEGNQAKDVEADTPEDAVCLLIITLFKEGILTKDDVELIFDEISGVWRDKDGKQFLPKPGDEIRGKDAAS